MSTTKCRVMVIGGFAGSLVNFRGDLLKTMVAKGHHVSVCAPSANREVKNALDKIGVFYSDIPIKRTGLNPFHDIKTLLALILHMKGFKPDIVLSYTIKPVIFGSIAARFSKVPHIFSMITGLGYAFIEGGFKISMLRSVVILLYRISLRFNEKVFFQNPDDLALFSRLGIFKKNHCAILINGSGVNIEKYTPNLLPEKITFLLIARLLKDKGIYEYIEAARVIKKKYEYVSFKLVGWLDGNPACIERDDLDSWVQSGIIGYLGKLDDVRPAIESASVYVLPSYYREGTPRTVLEAMAMGRPIVTTDAPGCRETVKDGENGFLVPIKDVNALVESMEKFILEPDLIKKMGKRSREIAEEKYDVHKVNAVIMRTMGLISENTV